MSWVSEASNSKRLISAAWIAPMDAPPLRDGAVVIANARIAAVGEARQLRRDYAGAEVEELGDVVLMPGLVNAHTHLELSDLSCGESPTSFVDWILSLIGRTARLGAADGSSIANAMRIGIEQCLRFGVTTVGDISKQCRFSRPVLGKSSLRAVSFGEIQAMAQRRNLLEERFAAASDRSEETERLIVSVTPHAPWSVEAAGYRRCLEWANQLNRPIATHLAENPEEAEFLAEHTGPFRYLWEAGINAWDDDVPRHDGGPIRLARDLGLLDFPTLLAHVNYCSNEELAIVAGGRASVVYCPRTHKYFGHPPHRWREMMKRGINVAVGTDSCASSPDLNLVDDLRLLHKLEPDVPAIVWWKMATIHAAKALRLDDQVGSIRAGKRADLTAFAAPHGDPLAGILERQAIPVGVWIDGERNLIVAPA